MPINQIIINSIADFEVIVNAILSDDFPQKLEKKTFECMWCISFDSSVSKATKMECLTMGIASLLDNIQKQAHQKNILCTFYMWFDEMAEQLRFNIIPGYQTKLPFGCHVVIVNSPKIILQQCIASDGNGIPWNEFVVVDNDDSNDDDVEDTYVLQVFVEHIYPIQ